MRRSFYVPAAGAAALAALLATGCGKKKSEQTAEASPTEVTAADSDFLASAERAPSPVARENAAATVQPADPAPVAEITDHDDAVDSTIPAPSHAAQEGDYQKWFAAHGLDLEDPQMLHADPDGDGFSNRDEFLGDSDPNDKISIPGMHKTLRLTTYHESRVPLILEEVSDKRARVRVESSGSTESVSEGGTIKGLPFRIAEVTRKVEQDKHGEEQDISQITVENTESGERWVLIKDLPTRTADSYATMAAADGETIRVHQGEEFVEPETGTTYRVVDIRPEGVVIEDLSTRKVLTVPKR